ncbi:MAG: twin-arginine translocase subunit TatC [Solirubrobacterales bacterium]
MAQKRLRPVSHEQELSVVEHLDELRTRMLTVAAAFVAVLAVAFWQNQEILDFINKPLPDDKVPATFGVSEAFMSTLTVSMYAALIVTLPLILWHLYAFVIPAFSEQERKVATPLLVLTPVLFFAGVAFAYVVVIPAAVKFLLGFNDDQFNILVRAKDYYSFFGMTALSMGMLFEMPLAILIASRIGLVSPAQLRQNRRYAVLVIAVVAMLLPGTDPVTMLISMVPLLLLFEASIWLAVWWGKPSPLISTGEAPVKSGDSTDSTPPVR